VKFLLDTNAVIALLRRHAGFLSKMTQHRPVDFGIPSIVAHELYFGAYKGQRVEHNLAQIENLPFEVLDFDREDARSAGEIRAALQLAGTTIGAFDTLIAGQAVARDLTVITHNMREFTRVQRLRTEDWEA
jgi:tRNA(fMet)-specific endonuclease VapC